MRRLISAALGIVMIILAGCSFSVPVREEESTDSTVVIKADQKEDTEQARETENQESGRGESGTPTGWRNNIG